jgi:hypothetical protein
MFLVTPTRQLQISNADAIQPGCESARRPHNVVGDDSDLQLGKAKSADPSTGKVKYGLSSLRFQTRPQLIPPCRVQLYVPPDEREQMTLLCQRIAVEQDRDKFTELVDQLNELLEHKGGRLNPASKTQSA